MKSTVFTKCAGILLALSSSLSFADTYPSKPVTIIVPTTAGGIADNVSRLIGSKLGELWGKAVVIENRSGAGTQIGSEAVAKSKPDGYTLMVAYTELVTLPALNSGLRFNVIDDFTRITKLGNVPAVIATKPSLPANNLNDLLSLLKSSPGKYTYGSGGPGSIMQLYGELFKQKAGVDVLHIPYRGSAEATLAVMGGDVDIMFQLASANVVAHSQAGKLKLIAATTPRRISRLPEVPTTSESGMSEYQVQAWYGVFAPAGLPAELVNKINADVAKVVAIPDVQERMATLGIEIETSSPAEFDAFVRAEHDLWGGLIRSSGIHTN